MDRDIQTETDIEGEQSWDGESKWESGQNPAFREKEDIIKGGECV